MRQRQVVAVLKALLSLIQGGASKRGLLESLFFDVWVDQFHQNETLYEDLYVKSVFKGEDGYLSISKKMQDSEGTILYVPTVSYQQGRCNYLELPLWLTALLQE